MDTTVDRGTLTGETTFFHANYYENFDASLCNSLYHANADSNEFEDAFNSQDIDIDNDIDTTLGRVNTGNVTSGRSESSSES
jgi:hypothetical protein